MHEEMKNSSTDMETIKHSQTGTVCVVLHTQIYIWAIPWRRDCKLKRKEEEWGRGHSDAWCTLWYLIEAAVKASEYASTLWEQSNGKYLKVTRSIYS